MSSASYFLEEAAPRLHYLAYQTPGPAPDPARPVLLFLHGATSHAHYWDHLASNFTPYYNVYSLDWRGHGESDPATDYGNIEGYLSDLGRLIEHLSPSQIFLVGHSLGGYVGLIYAAETGDIRLKKLVIADMATGLSDEAIAFMQKAAARPAQNFENLAELAAKFRATLRDSTADPALLERLAHQGARSNPDGTYSFKYDRRALAFPVPDPARYAPRVKIPTLVINGKQSSLVSREQASGVAGLLPQGRHLEIQGAGHHVFLDRPREFSQGVLDFLQP